MSNIQLIIEERARNIGGFLIAIAFPEVRYIYWNFVSSCTECIEAACLVWLNGEFLQIEGESGAGINMLEHPKGFKWIWPDLMDPE